MEPTLCLKWKKAAPGSGRNSRGNLKMSHPGLEVSEPPCLWGEKAVGASFIRRNIKSTVLSPFYCPCFPTYRPHFYGTAWLQRSAPGVWQQKDRGWMNGWWMSSFAGPGSTNPSGCCDWTVEWKLGERVWSGAWTRTWCSACWTDCQSWDALTSCVCVGSWVVNFNEQFKIY